MKEFARNLAAGVAVIMVGSFALFVFTSVMVIALGAAFTTIDRWFPSTADTTTIEVQTK